MKNYLVLAGALLLTSTAVMADIDCDALANSALAEPTGYAQECLGMSVTAPEATAPRAPTDTAYAHDIGFVSDNFVAHQVGDLGTQVTQGTNAEAFFAYDFDPTGTTLYAHNFTTGMFGTMDPTTAVFTPIAPATGITGTFSGLTIDPVSGAAYALETDGATSTLHSFDLGTGAATPIGTITGVTLAIDLAMNCEGELYVHDIATDSLYSVNPADGTPTLVGAHGLAANFAQGMDFDNDDGTLYGYIYTGGGTNTYAAWNTTDGSITPLSVDNPQGEWEGAIPTTCFVAPPTPVIEVPTVNRLGALVLFGLLAGAALLVFRRMQ